METIVVAYWYGRMEKTVGIKHNEKFDYSDEKRNEIIDLILEKGLNIMLFQQKDTLIIWIDNKKFQQR